MSTAQATEPLAVGADIQQLARRLKATLHKIGYLTYYLSFCDGNLRYPDIERAARLLPSTLREAVEFFLVGKKADRERLAAILGHDVLLLLLRFNIVRIDDEGLAETAYSFIGFRDYWFFADRVEKNPLLYYGADSIALATFQCQLEEGPALDVCSGPGIQAMIASRGRESVTSVEVNPRAAEVQTLNLAINGLTDRITVWNMAFAEFGRITDQHYSLVTCNPPLLPIPVDTKYPFVGDGGPDGLGPMRELVGAFASRLTDLGSIQIIGTGLGSERRYAFYESIRELAESANLGIRVNVLSKWSLEPGATLFNSLVATSSDSCGGTIEELSEMYHQHYVALGATHIFPFFAVFSKERHEPLLIDISSYAYGTWFA